MKERKFPNKIIKWYEHFLISRTAFTELNGITRQIKIKRGTAQGGILSPLIWNMVFESFLKIFEQGPISPVGFADDCSLLIKSIYAETCKDLMNQALKKTKKWGEDRKLKFIPQKIVSIFSTGKIDLKSQKSSKLMV